MSKKIVVCCDGTGNQYGERNSNVVKLYQVLGREAGKQIAYYHPGVGTMGSKNALSGIGKTWTLLRGLAFGYGVSENIADAYQFLMRSYEKDDEVYVFGFSRGAYTARALCGMLQMFGLLAPGNEGMIPYAFRLFKSKKKDKFKVAAGFRSTFCTECKPRFLGAWDSVSSVGWIIDPIGMKPWSLPYTAELGDVPVVRHAVSIDERRTFYRQNLVHENSGNGRSVKQVWFAGVHSDIGGCYPELQGGLSKIPFQWIVREAMEHGLLVDTHELARVLGSDPRYARPYVNGALHNSMKWWWPLEFWPKRVLVRVSPPGEKPARFKPRWWPNLFRRRPVPAGARIHQSVVSRQALDPVYRPKNVPYPVPPDQIEVDPVPAPPFASWEPVQLTMGEKLAVNIAARPKWNGTPLQVKAGETYRLEASGTWHDASIPAGPKGYPSPNLRFRIFEQLRRRPKANWFTLICMVDYDPATAFDFTDGELSEEGRWPKVTIEHQISKDGFLNCYANDLPFTYWNNSGAVRLVVTRIAQQTIARKAAVGK